MNYIVDIRMLGEDLVEAGFIGDINAIEIRSLAANQFDSVDRLLRRVVETINNDNFVAGFEECKGGKRTNVSRTPGSCQYFHQR